MIARGTTSHGRQRHDRDGGDPQGSVDRDGPTRPARSGSSPAPTSTWRRSTPAWSTRRGDHAAAARRRQLELARAPGLALRRPRRSPGRRPPTARSASRRAATTTLARVWQLAPGPEDGVVYAGTEPGAVWQLRPTAARRSPSSRPCGTTPQRPEWGAGFGGQAFHTILPHPTDPRVGDGGDLHRRRLPDHRRRASRGSARNQGIKAEFLPRASSTPSSASACTR